MTLGGALFIKDGFKYDYCFEQSIECLKELCDQVSIVAIQSDYGTTAACLKYQDEKTNVFILDESEWEKQHGREKLAYFQNLALSFLDTDYYFLLQGDEIVHEKSFSAIREAVETNGEAFLCSRINLWRDCNSYLNVPIERQPCNTSVIRLAKIKYRSIGDGESIDAFADDNFVSQIRIYHMGFVRKKEVMKDKVKNMQSNVFQIDYDKKLDQSEIFDWRLWFSNEDLSPIKEPLPKFIQEWASVRP